MLLKRSLFALAVVAGIAGFVADTVLNVEHVKGGGDWNGPSITTIVIAVMSSLALTVTVLAWQTKRKLLASLCLIGFGASVAFSAPVSYARIQAAINTQQEATGAHNQKVDLLKQAHAETKALRISESKNGGCGRNCKALLAKEQELMDQIIKAGVRSTKQLNETITMSVPIAAVVALICLMNGLFVFGLSSFIETMPKPRPAPKKRRARRKVRRKKPTANNVLHIAS